MDLGLHTRIMRIADLMATSVDKEIVIMNLAKNNYVALDDIGRHIWDILKKPCRIDELCQQLSREYKVDLEQVTADVLPFLNELQDEGLVCVADEV
ncbi:hypothetical protein SPSIL_026390 [Sporomusa silvacetica DSM 10669]|uniref:Coenzyme PQQ synthesis protein D n=1 Tax=Sporomusa silvacetica DSM 10669 TaxID=1123289 RepID=A0ABZ3ILC0_9FIRM|nr:PqqD family peptide modification chaperone [Sporomusa silvacetica]OZC22984.1 coenzyme PQQ synthesis protein D [Sporomusa silvacetica DSM 10669]